MKHCTYCGKEYSDEADMCPLDGNPLKPVGARPSDPISPPVHNRDTISNEERRFWEQMTFRQFAVLMVQLQAICFLFYAMIDVTYLPRYFRGIQWTSTYYPLYKQLNFDLFLAVLRIILHVAAAIALIQYAERVLSWLVKDSIPKAQR